MNPILKKAAPFNKTSLGAWAEAETLRSLSLAVRVLANRNKLSLWYARTLAEISGFGGVTNE